MSATRPRSSSRTSLAGGAAARRGVAAAAAAIALVAAPAAAQEAHEPWPLCPAVVADAAAEGCGVPASFCDAYEFVRTIPVAGADSLSLVARTSGPLWLSSTRPLAFLDLDSPLATLAFVASEGQASAADLSAFRCLWSAVGSDAFPYPASGLATAGVQVELLVDAQLFTLATRMGVFFPEVDPTNVFSQVLVVSSPSRNLLLVAGVLTDQGREFFRAFAAQGIAGLDALIGWRIHRTFGADVEIASTGWFPCVKAGPHVSVRGVLALIDRKLASASIPINLSNVQQLVSCQ